MLTGTLLLLGLAWLHASHEVGGAWLQNLAVAFNLALIMGLVLLAWPRLPQPMLVDSPLVDFDPGAFFTALIWVSFSYSGWNAAVYIGGEVRDPERNLPRALLVGTGLVMALYLALNSVFVRATEPAVLAGQADIGRLAALALGGPPWAKAVTLLVAFALSLSASALMMAGPRVYARMARDGVFPHWFVPGEGGSPRRAIGLQCALALVLLWSLGFRELGFTLGLSTSATVFGLVRLRWREGERCPVTGWPWVPAIYLLAVAGMVGSAIVRQPVASGWGVATILGVWVVSRLVMQRRRWSE